jgi:ribonuclease BN (tRNA processing enzyme)
VTLWGTRGSLATPGPESVRYGGNTSCVEVRGEDGSLLVLDAGTGVRRLGDTIRPEIGRVDLLLTHMHMDHIQGLGFFEPLFMPDLPVHIWGPSSTTEGLRERLQRYLSPPLFPVRLRDLPCRLTLHDVVQLRNFRIGPFQIDAQLVCHPGPTVGYRIRENEATLAYIPDHEPALGASDFPGDPEWLSGIDLARGVDLLIHDCQFSDEQYPQYVGWGHCAISHTLNFAKAAGVKTLVPFHYDPTNSDPILDELFAKARAAEDWPFDLIPGQEGETFHL